ncbi:DNA primase large subunit [Hypsibius exemplaris]|uniref:DNA primase large subunit n=1 Tax=Hypsibius exemplaris TaxID=2072580 RepID=A0A1W0WYC9_HYPEX|nr:DNA primase large subunit [Hypsibius exemplaris]
MEVFGSAQKPTRRQAIYAGKKEETEDIFTVNFFLDPPYFEDITLQDFETYALERLKVLRIFENAAFKTTRGSPEYHDLILKELPKEMRYRYVRPLNGTAEDVILENRRLDVLSHFILRMVFSRNEEQKRWFIQQEVDLFRYRLSGETAGSVGAFFRVSNFNYTPLPDEEFRNIRPILEKSTFFKHGQISVDTEFYKLDFLEALAMVKKRHVFLSMGYAYVPRRLLVEVVADRFRDYLGLEIARLSKIILESQEDTRLLPVMAKLAVGYTGKDYSGGELDFGITPENLDQLSTESFPLCARNMHEHMRKDHHLKHEARLQFGLFLKGIGLSCDDAVRLFRQEFSKHGISEKQFNQGYKYNVEHQYGRVGRRVNYAPPSCTKIITTKPPNGPLEHHGCPFKHFTGSLLEQRLKTYGLPPKDMDAIKELAQKGHFQGACTKYFEFTHRKKLTTVVDQIQHPNQYFEESRRLIDPDSVKDRPPIFSRRRPVLNAIKTEPGNSQAFSQAPPDMSDMDTDFHMTDAEMEEAMRAHEMEVDPSPGDNVAV